MPNLKEIWMFEDKIVQITLTSETGFNCKDIHTGKEYQLLEEKLTPIPISEVWLKELSFSYEYDASGEGWFSLPLLNKNSSLAQFKIQKNGQKYIIIFSDMFYMDLHYVHELQNLFTTLSGGRFLLLKSYN